MDQYSPFTVTHRNGCCFSQWMKCEACHAPPRNHILVTAPPVWVWAISIYNYVFVYYILCHNMLVWFSAQMILHSMQFLKCQWLRLRERTSVNPSMIIIIIAVCPSQPACSIIIGNIESHILYQCTLYSDELRANVLIRRRQRQQQRQEQATATHWTTLCWWVAMVVQYAWRTYWINKRVATVLLRFDDVVSMCTSTHTTYHAETKRDSVWICQW